MAFSLLYPPLAIAAIVGLVGFLVIAVFAGLGPVSPYPESVGSPAGLEAVSALRTESSVICRPTCGQSRHRRDLMQT